MTNTIDHVEWLTNQHPERHQGGAWHNRCEQWVNNAGGFSQTFQSARHAREASGELDDNWHTAGPGAIHYWGGGGLIDGVMNPGHVGIQTHYGVSMASDATGGKNGVGFIKDVPTYNNARPAMHYLGHTRRHGTETLAGLTTSSLNEHPITAPAPPRKKATHMRILQKDTTKTYFLADDVRATITPLPDGKVRSHLILLDQAAPLVVTDDELNSYIETFEAQHKLGAIVIPPATATNTAALEAKVDALAKLVKAFPRPGNKFTGTITGDIS